MSLITPTLIYKDFLDHPPDSGNPSRASVSSHPSTFTSPWHSSSDCGRSTQKRSNRRNTQSHTFHAKMRNHYIFHIFFVCKWPLVDTEHTRCSWIKDEDDPPFPVFELNTVDMQTMSSTIKLLKWRRKDCDKGPRVWSVTNSLTLLRYVNSP